MKREKGEYAVQSVNNFIDILELLSNSEGELSVSDVGIKLSLTKNNASKILSTLELFGYVECNRYTGNYRLGVKTFQISQAYMIHLNLIEISKIYIENIRNRLNETAYVSVLRDNNVVFLNMVETNLPVRVRSRIGNIVPTYASASGKVHLAYMDEDSVRAMFSDGLSKVTDTTIVSMEGLLKELNNVRKLGYAIDNEEFETEVISFSAPVLNFLGKVVAALSVSTPKIRVNNNRIENEIVPTIKKEANKLSEKYGYKLS